MCLRQNTVKTNVPWGKILFKLVNVKFSLTKAKLVNVPNLLKMQKTFLSDQFRVPIFWPKINVRKNSSVFFGLKQIVVRQFETLWLFLELPKCWRKEWGKNVSNLMLSNLILTKPNQLWYKMFYCDRAAVVTHRRSTSLLSKILEIVSSIPPWFFLVFFFSFY